MFYFIVTACAVLWMQSATRACSDDPSYDCAHINTVFNICADIDHASKYCRNFCNLCNYIPANTCADDPTFDCAHISKAFDICADVAHASVVCRKFCNLCPGVTPCQPNPCDHGTCSSTGGSAYSCTCNSGYAGTNCDTAILPCSSQPCINGKCIDKGTGYTCQCNIAYYGLHCDKKVRDCKDILDNHVASPTNDAIFTVMIGQHNENVRCDMSTDGGGWTVIMNRETSTSNFLQKSTEYAIGFGYVRGDFWIGLDDMHALTSDGRRYQLMVELTRGDGRKYYEVYDDFSIGHRPTFVLHIGQARGNASDSLRTHDGHSFTTIDADHDTNNGTNCAQYLQGAWWFNDCYDSCLTCPYVAPGSIQCRSMSWNTVNYCEALKSARMLVRPMRHLTASP